MKTLHVLLILLLPVVFAGTASANVYINEDFEDGVAFDHAAGNATGGAVDFYDTDGATIGTTTSLTTTGAVTTARALSGNSSLELGAGEDFAVVHGLECPDCERLIFQMAVSIGAHSEADGTTLAEWRMPYTGVDGPLNYSFYWQLVSDGAGGADIVAGQDGDAPVAPTTIGHVSAMDMEWVVVTFVYNRVADDPDPYFGTIPSGFQFFAGSEVAGLAADTPANGEAGFPTFEVLAGRVFVDDVYWEIGLDDANVDDMAARNLQEITVPMALSEFSSD